MIPYVPDNLSKEMIDSQLGNSVGIKNKMNSNVLNREMKQMLSENHETNQAAGLMDMIKKRRERLDSRANSLSF